MKTKDIKFVLQITENNLKILKCLCKDKIEILGCRTESISGLKDEQIQENLKKILKELQFKKESIIICLPRNQVTLRYLKVPSQELLEIEKILNLQVSQYLPYPREELVCGFSIIRKDTEGFSYVNLVIVHQNVINRYFRILKDFENQIEAVLLSSYGLWNWYKGIEKKEILEPTVIINLEPPFTEIAILREENLLFSRSLCLPQEKSNWTKRLAEEIDLTKEVYLKEAIDAEPKKIIFTGSTEEIGDLGPNLIETSSLAVEISPSEPLAGLCRFKFQKSLNFLPSSIKEKRKKLSLKREYVKVGLLFFLSLSMFSLGLAVTFYNKKNYLNRLKSELNKISSDAGEIEAMKKVLAVIDLQTSKRKIMDVIHELYHLIPPDISLVRFIYDEEGVITLRGRAQDLSSVFNFVPILERSEIFKNAKVRYATKRKAQTGEIIDFEIICGIVMR